MRTLATQARRTCLMAAMALLSACVTLPPMQTTPAVLQPLTMPPADGRSQTLTLHVAAFPDQYVLNRQTVASRTGIALRVTRLNGGDLDHSQGKAAKDAVEFYCAQFNRHLDPVAMGRFSVPNSWVFDGDCV